MVAVLHDEICPISEQLLFSLYDAAKRGLPVPVSDAPKERRSSVALFCYRRGHLEQAGLAVAATCDEEDLIEVGGSLGRTLFLKSRDFTSAPKNNSRDSFRAMLISIAASKTAEAEDDKGRVGSLT